MNNSAPRSYFVFLCLLNIFFASALAQPVAQNDFESWSNGTVYTQSSWTTDGFTVPWVNGFDQNRAYIDNTYAHSGSNSLRIYYPAGQYGPSSTGAQAPLKVTGQQQYYISYWLRFSDTFSWGTSNEGGKLPGLAGGSNCSGCSACTGTNGFSARLMWRTGGRGVLYLYNMDKQATCGDDYQLVVGGNNVVFQRGQWYQVTERVKVNTGANHDGEAEVWINGEQAVLVTGLEFVNNGDLVDNLYFSTFHGGSDATWAPTVDSYIWFDDIVISTNSADVFTSVSGVKNSQNDNSDIVLYPQPIQAGKTFSIKFDGNPEDIKSLEWLDTVGKRVYYNSQPSGSQTQVAPPLKTGEYVLKIQTRNKITYLRVFVE